MRAESMTPKVVKHPKLGPGIVVWKKACQRQRDKGDGSVTHMRDVLVKLFVPATAWIGYTLKRNFHGDTYVFARAMRATVPPPVPGFPPSTNPYPAKCRTMRAYVLGRYHEISGDPLKASALVTADYDWDFIYPARGWVKAKRARKRPFRLRAECATGIHFFLTREEAAGYVL